MRVTKTKETRHDLEKIFQYAQLSMQYTQDKDPLVAEKLRAIEQELEMGPEEIMDIVIRNTDTFSNSK